MDDDAIQALGTMGWTGPADPKSNFTRTWTQWTGVDRSQVVDDIVGTLRLVYEMPSDGPMWITTGH